MGTPKQEKLLKLIFANLGKPGETKTMGEMLLEAGYSKAQSVNPKQILETKDVKEGVEDFVKTLKDKRKMAITKLTNDKLDASSAKDLTSITDILTKNIQLLSGDETERGELVIKWEK